MGVRRAQACRRCGRIVSLKVTRKYGGKVVVLPHCPRHGTLEVREMRVVWGGVGDPPSDAFKR